MTATIKNSRPPPTTPPAPTHGPDKAITLALRLAHAENALLALTAGQVDAIVAPSGQTYLLRPAQEQLRQSERRLQTVLESSADVITVVNRGGAIISQSPAVSGVLGYEPEELVGSSIFELIHQEDLSAAYSAFFNVIEGFHANATVPFRHRARDGSYRLIEATVGKLRSASSEGVVFSLRPITNHRLGRTEPVVPSARDLSQAGEDRELANVSHGQRTPLMDVLLGIAALEEKVRIFSAKPEIEPIRRMHELKARLLEDPLEFTKSRQPKVRLRLESIDAHEAARSALELCDREVAAALVEVLLDLRAEEKNVQADWARLLEVLCTLVKNAVEFSTPGSTIAIVSTNEVPGRFTFELVDRGGGLDPPLLPRILDSFPRGDFSAQQLDCRLRSGLNVARRLAEAQGGTLTASSKGGGKGPTFHLTLNTAPSPNAARPIVPLDEPCAPPVYPLSVLLVEYRKDAALAGLLEQCGYAFLAAPDMLTGLALAENCRFDLVISDITLPDGTGHELMERVRRTRPSLAGIALSRFGMPSDIDQSREAGFSEHLVRPVSLDGLQSAIQAVVAAKRCEARYEMATA